MQLVPNEREDYRVPHEDNNDEDNGNDNDNDDNNDSDNNGDENNKLDRACLDILISVVTFHVIKIMYGALRKRACAEKKTHLGKDD